MNAEIPKGLKQHLFSMYIGAKVEYTYHEYDGFYLQRTYRIVGIINGISKTFVSIYGNDFYADFKEHDPVLQLRPLSSLTDSEAIEVAKLQGVKTNSMPKPHFDLHSLEVCLCPYSNDYYDAISVLTYQYLQQKGFALPVYYDGKLFSVADLEQMQIIKTV